MRECSVEVWSSVPLLQGSELQHQGTAWQQLLLVRCRNKVAILVRAAQSEVEGWDSTAQCWASVPPACSQQLEQLSAVPKQHTGLTVRTTTLPAACRLALAILAAVGCTQHAGTPAPAANQPGRTVL